MNRIAFALSAALLLVPAGTAFAGADYMRDDGTFRYRFYTEWELLYVDRSDSDDIEVGFFDSANVGSEPAFSAAFREVLSTDAVVEDDSHFGGRAVIGFRIDEQSAVEGIFTGWGHNRSAQERDVVGENLFAFIHPDLNGAAGAGINDAAFDQAAVFDLDYESELYSGEINYRRHVEVESADYRFNLIAGFRTLRLEEDLGFTSLDDFPAVPNGIGTYNIATRNTLIGAQVGVETFVPLIDDRLDFDFYAVAGGFANLSSVTIEYASNATRFRDSRQETDAAGVFELAAHLKVRVWRGVQLKGGYRAVYATGVATAPDQFARSGSAGDFLDNFDSDGTALFHGPSISMSVDF